MLEKVNQYHPDKVADRVAGAIVDYAYTLEDNPKIAVEVLIGHGRATVIAETSVTLDKNFVAEAMKRIASIPTDHLCFIQVPQDIHLSENQSAGLRCGDNGVFTAKWSIDYEKATNLAQSYGRKFPYDGKYLFDFECGMATLCQSNAMRNDIQAATELLYRFNKFLINPLGDWTGGTNTDTGCTNRKLGSDQPFCNPNGLHGKDLSKADVSVSIYTNDLSRKLGGAVVTAHCSIGDTVVAVITDDGFAEKKSFAEIVEFAREYIRSLGGFESFAEYGMRWI